MHGIALRYLKGGVMGVFQFVCTENYSDSTAYQKRGDGQLVESDSMGLQPAAFPNPVRKGEELRMLGLAKGPYKVQLTDLNGRVMLADEIMIKQGEYLRLTVPFNLSEGIYLIRVGNFDKTVTYKISVL